MKHIKIIILLIALTFLIGCSSNTISIGEYHKLNNNDLDNLIISSMSHNHSNEELHQEESQKLYDFILNTEPMENNLEDDNKKILTTLNYIIVVNLNDSFYHIETGDDYISISFENQVDDSLETTIHIIDEKEMEKLNNLIEDIFHH